MNANVEENNWVRGHAFSYWHELLVNQSLAVTVHKTAQHAMSLSNDHTD